MDMASFSELSRTFAPIVSALLAFIGLTYAIRSYALSKMKKAGPASYRSNKVKKAVAALGAAAYTIFPIDLVPDLLIPFGFIDDLGVIGVAIVYFVLHPSKRRLSAR